MIEPGTKNGEILRRPPRMKSALRFLDQRQAADAGTDAHADPLAVAGVVLDARVAHRLHRGDEPVVDERVVAARFLRRKILRDVEVLDLAGDPRRERRRVEARDRRDARARVPDRVPRGGTPTPTGETIPSPVTTTRRRVMGSGPNGCGRESRRAARPGSGSGPGAPPRSKAGWAGRDRPRPPRKLTS